MKGQKVVLVPAELNDRRRVYEWCFQSETTKSHTGPPDYPEKSIASYEEFCAEYYEEYFFTGAKPEDGRGYLIVYEDTAVGFISYSSFHVKAGIAELDIWMDSEANCGMGFGTDAILILSEFLNRANGISELIIAPAMQNKRAVRSYEKAGFTHSAKAMVDFLESNYVALYGSGDYGLEETALMVKSFH
ncbi:GNAT family N-acetyltransferase [Enterococcus larvae]|uniref:GNAT family N-acetyltransferase n=1 Tax=Enterococcus larvae TaxID=2794352 RepID=UPI003F40A022